MLETCLNNFLPHHACLCLSAHVLVPTHLFLNLFTGDLADKGSEYVYKVAGVAEPSGSNTAGALACICSISTTYGICKGH
jgi:hypothetical protein